MQTSFTSREVRALTGITLPFISYGGSGLMALMIGVGLVESVVMRHKELEF